MDLLESSRFLSYNRIKFYDERKMPDEIISQWWLLILVGIAAGLASGLLGIGGGVVIVPSLVLLFSVFGQKTAQGTSLAVMIPMAFVGTLRYIQNPNVSLNWYAVALLAIGAIAGSLFGSWLVTRLPASFLRKAFGVLLVIIAFKMFFSKPQSPVNSDQKKHSPNTFTQKQKGEFDFENME